MAHARDKETTTVELGPRSLALMRRMVALLEQLVGDEMSDPGKDSEIDAYATDID